MSEDVPGRDVVLRCDGAVATVQLNRPDLGNAVTPAQAEQLRAILEQLDADDAIRVVVLTGSGGSFNVGAYRPPGDPPALQPVADRAARYRAQIPTMLRAVEILHSSDLVSIAAVNGACAGAGLALALAADLRYAADTAGFNTAFLSVGLPGELGAIWFATRLLGAARARELFLLPARSSAREMADIGLLNAVFGRDELTDRVAEIAARIAGFDQAALRAMKANLNLAVSNSLPDYLETELDNMLACLDKTPEKG